MYDAGALVAADRSDRRAWARHRALLERGTAPAVPATVVAQTSRSPRQTQLRRLLRGCEVVTLDEPSAHAVGVLLARSGTSDVVDGSVAVLAVARRAATVTGARADIEHLLAASGTDLPVLDA